MPMAVPTTADASNANASFTLVFILMGSSTNPEDGALPPASEDVLPLKRKTGDNEYGDIERDEDGGERHERLVVEHYTAGHLRDPEADDRHDDEATDLLSDAHVVDARRDEDPQRHG